MNEQDQVSSTANAKATNIGFCPFSCCASMFSGAMPSYLSPSLFFLGSFGLVIFAALSILTILAGLLAYLLGYWTS